MISFSIFSLGIDIYPSPTLISRAELSLLSNDPAAAFYQPATTNVGISIHHSNPFGFFNLNTFQLSSQFRVFQEMLSLGTIVLDDHYLSEQVFYGGYNKRLSNFTFGCNFRYYSQKVQNYQSLAATTLNIATLWQNYFFLHGVSVSNVTSTKVKEIDLPVVFKYECAISPFPQTSFALAMEKENLVDLRYSFGVSQNLLESLSISTGFQTNPQQFSAGFGVLINNLTIQYGFRTHQELNYTQAVGIIYNL